jgi:hypothetical protein
MKKLFLILLALCFAWQVQAVQIKAIRSLNAAVGTSTVNGGFFDGAINPLPPSGGGIQWTVLITATAPATGTIGIQIQEQMTDGTWIPIIPNPASTNNNTNTISVPTTGVANTTMQVFFIPGPAINMRVAITSASATGGTVTADIIVNF